MMDMLKACVLSLLLVAVTASPQEDDKRASGRFYISLSDIPILGNLFAHNVGNETESNKTTTLKHLQFYPILPSLITSGEQLNTSDADANGKANCNQHNNHIHSHSGSYIDATQKLTNVNSYIQSKPAQIKPSNGAVPSLSMHHNTVIPVSADGQNQPGLMFQNPFSPTRKPSGSNAFQGQGVSSTTASSAVSPEKPGFFDIFHATEAPQTVSTTTKRPLDSYWSESFGIPSYPIVPGFAKPPAAPQNPHVPTQTPVNAPNYPFFPFGQWPGDIQMPGAFGIPEGAVNLPTGIFQYPPQFVQVAHPQLPTTQVQGHNEPFANIWPTKQPQNSQVQNGDLNSNKEAVQPTGAPQTSQETGSSQGHQVHHIYQPGYGQYNWPQGFPYVSYTPQLQSLISNSEGNVQALPETQQNSAGSFQHTTSTQEQEMASQTKPQLQKFPQNYKNVYAPMPLVVQRL